MSKTKAKSRFADIAYEYLLGRLQSLQVTDDKIEWISSLYIMKERFERCPIPELVENCFHNNILDILMPILGQKFNVDDRSNQILYSLFLELIWLFSGVGQAFLGPLLSKPLITLLAQFVDVNNHFYHFSSAFTRKLESMCYNTRFLQQKIIVVPVTKVIYNDIKFYKPCMAKYLTINHLYQCHLNIQLAGRSEVFSVAQRMLSDHLAWKKPNESLAYAPVIKNIEDLVCPLHPSHSQADWPPAGQEKPGDCCQDIFILDIIGGHYFWAYIGREAINLVQLLSELILHELHVMRIVTPEVGDVVVVVEEEEIHGDKPSVMRAKVIEMTPDEVTVFTLDYGTVKKVQYCNCKIFELSGSAVCLAKFDAQAKLCCLAGVQAPPADESAVELTLAVLTNLSKHFIYPGEMFSEAVSVDNLSTLILCGPPNIRLRAIQLLSNISSITAIHRTSDFSKFIRPLLEELVYQSKQVPDKPDKAIILAALYALNSIMFCRPTNHELFFALKGHFVVLNLMRIFRNLDPHVKAAAGVLRIVYPGLMGINPGSYINIAFCKKDRAEGEENLMPQKPSRLASDPDGEEFSDEEISAIMKSTSSKLMLEEDTGSDNNNSSRKDKEPSPRQTVSELTCLGSLLTTVAGKPDHCPASYESRIYNRSLDKSQDSTNLVPVDACAIYPVKDNYYEYNTFVTFRDDITHHLLDAKDIDSIGIRNLAEIVCGMLNSKGGTIYAGLTKAGCVRGIHLTREDRDCVRLGLDDLMNLTSPKVTHTQLQMEYIKVVQKLASGQVEQLSNVFIIEINLEAPDDPVYFALGKPQICYQRFGASNLCMQEQEVRQMVVLEEESHYLPYVRQLRQQIKQLEEELEEEH